MIQTNPEDGEQSDDFVVKQRNMCANGLKHHLAIRRRDGARLDLYTVPNSRHYIAVESLFPDDVAYPSISIFAGQRS